MKLTAEMSAAQTKANLVANVQVIHRLITVVSETQFDGDRTRRHDRNRSCESVRCGKTTTINAIQQLYLWSRRRQRTNQPLNMHEHHKWTRLFSVYVVIDQHFHSEQRQTFWDWVGRVSARCTSFLSPGRQYKSN